jgi:TPR repeat protein
MLTKPLVASDQQRVTLANDIKVAHLKWFASKPEVQFTMGLAYEEGRGVSQTYPQGLKQDYAEAVEFYRKAANQGLAKAQFKLGWMYESGQGIPQDYAEAVKWYRSGTCSSAEQSWQYVQEWLWRTEGPC